MELTKQEVLAQVREMRKLLARLETQLTGAHSTGWQSSKAFMLENNIGRTRLNTLIARKDVEQRKITSRYYEYRWKRIV